MEVRTPLLRLMGAVAVAALTLASCGGGDDEGTAADTEPAADAGAAAGGVDISAFTALGEDLCTLVSPEAVADAVGLPLSTPDFTSDVSLICTWNFGEELRPPTLVLDPDSYANALGIAQSPFSPVPATQIEVAGRPAIISPPDPEAGEFASADIYVQLGDSPDGPAAHVYASTEERALALAELLTPALVGVLG